MPMLKLDKHDPQKELEFDVACEINVDPNERLKHWWEWNQTMLEFLEKQKGESQYNPHIIKRS